MKRLLREAFEQEAARLPAGHDVVIVARPEARASPSARASTGIRSALAELIDQLRARARRGRMSALRAVAIAPIRALPAASISPLLPRALQVRADVLALRRAGDQRVRHTARAGARRRGGCCAAIRGATAATTPSTSSASSAAPTAPERLTPMPMPVVFANILQPLIDVFEPVLCSSTTRSGSAGAWSIIVLTVSSALVAAAADVQAVKSMQELQRLAPEIKAIQDEVQGRQAAPAAGDHEVLPGEQGQPLASCLPLVAAAAGLHLAVLHAAHGPAAGHLPGTTARKAWHDVPRHTARRRRRRDRREFLFIPDLTARRRARADRR